MKPVKSFRIDQKILDQAKKLGLNISQIVEAAIAKAVKDKRCPFCGKKLAIKGE